MRTVILLAVLALPCCLEGQQDAFVPIIQKVKLAIFPVACGTAPDSNNSVTVNEIEGTGFFVNYQGDFITAGHVINQYFKWDKKGNPDPKCFPVIYLPSPTWLHARWFEFKSCTVDDSVDIAACKTTVNPFTFAELHLDRLHLSTAVPEDGTQVAFTGFPQFILVPVTSRADVASSASFFTAGLGDIVLDKTTWHGVSGGPVYLANGDVIGIIRETGEGVWSGLAFARQTSAILKFLTDKNIPIWQQEPEQHKTKK